MSALVSYVRASFDVSRNLSLSQIHQTKSGAAEQQTIRPRMFSNNLRKIGEKFRRGRQVTNLAPTAVVVTESKQSPLLRLFFFLRRTLAENKALCVKQVSDSIHLLFFVVLFSFLVNSRPGTQQHPMARRTPTNF